MGRGHVGQRNQTGIAIKQAIKSFVPRFRQLVKASAIGFTMLESRVYVNHFFGKSAIKFLEFRGRESGRLQSANAKMGPKKDAQCVWLNTGAVLLGAMF
jgi:hypothetical protein